jgi:hypothetical protein
MPFELFAANANAPQTPYTDESVLIPNPVGPVVPKPIIPVNVLRAERFAQYTDACPLVVDGSVSIEKPVSKYLLVPFPVSPPLAPVSEKSPLTNGPLFVSVVPPYCVPPNDGPRYSGTRHADRPVPQKRLRR